MTLINYETKLARFREEQERKKMSNSFRNKAAKLILEKMQQTKDPMAFAALANQLAKFEVSKQPRRPRSTPKPIEAKEPSLDELVADAEKKRKEARKSSGGSTEVAS